eukprot:7878410-Pyramimonas_sp.AAC.1
MRSSPVTVGPNFSRSAVSTSSTHDSFGRRICPPKTPRPARAAPVSENAVTAGSGVVARVPRNISATRDDSFDGSRRRAPLRGTRRPRRRCRGGVL